ncbi:hypothetical protein [Gracilimonas tropica]|uniref:hypothetical protein n=1 Tax=Gracilimonas tropica TaxID=454600 RepID=UPI0003764481|nr:hypothetical protein [Gracilimonas tropica]
MAGYDEVLYVMLSMVIVSTMALNANRVIQVNNSTMIEGQLEGQVVAYAQDIIEESRALAFDEETTYDSEGNSTVPVYIPSGFSALGPDDTSADPEVNRTQFDDFDDFHGFRESVSIGGVDYDVAVRVEYIETTNYQDFWVVSGKSTLKRITVEIQSKFLQKNLDNENTIYNFSFIRSYYAD